MYVVIYEVNVKTKKLSSIHFSFLQHFNSRFKSSSKINEIMVEI